MRPRARLAVRRRPDTGATLVEFALVAPLVFILIFGIIAGSFLAYQNSAMHDGATAGARMAAIENPLVTLQNNEYCESGSPASIEKAVSQASPLLTVNPAPLCAPAKTGPLTQPAVNGDVNITVTCGGSCAAPTTVEVSLALRTKGLVAPIGLTYNLAASSQVPVLSP